MKYSLYNQNKELVSNKYILSKKDIFGLSYIQRLYNIGVHSLKLEGRNKTPEYVAGVTKIYRKYLNDIINKNNEITVNQIDKKNLMQIFNRDGISDGYLGGVCYKNSITENIPKNTGIYLGKIILQKKEFVKIKLEEDISLHDGIEILDENDVIFSNVITCIKDERKNIVNETIKIDKNEILDVKWIQIEEIKNMDEKTLRAIETNKATFQDFINNKIYPLDIFDTRKYIL